MRKSWMCLVLTVCLLLTVAVPVRADEYDEIRQQMMDSFTSGKLLDISSYELTMEQVQDIYDGLYHSGQLPWYADADCDYVYNDKYIARFRPKVLNPRAYDRTLYEREMAELIAQTCTPEMSDWQKAVRVHDYIILHTAYDDQMQKNTGYDCLVSGSTICYGYAMLYMDVMNRLGIPCQIVICYDTGDGYGHAWNAVQLDGRWYHVDLTWDDPYPDIAGYVSHSNFLKTDEELRGNEQPHDFEWEALVEMAEEPYEADAFWEEVYSALCFVDADTVVYRKEVDSLNKIVSRNLTTGEETLLYEYWRKELNIGYGLYLYPTYGLNYWNGRLYFNREDRVLSMLPDGSDVQTVYTCDVDDTYLLGCMADQGVLYLTFTNHDMQFENQQVTLEDVEFHVHEYHRNTVKSTCQADGYYELACECGVAYNRTVIPQIDHLLQTRVEKAPTQQEAGIICHKCANCEYTEYEYPPALPAPEPEPQEPDPIPYWIPAAGGGAVLVCVLLLWVLRKRRSRAAAKGR